MTTRRLKTIPEMLASEPPACACATCRAYCFVPCWGIPSEIRRVIEAGYGSRLALDGVLTDHMTWVLCPAVKGDEGKFLPFTIGECIASGGCTFWNEIGRCDLHALGLKPLEGRMAHHDSKFQIGDWIRDYIASQWDTEEGRQLVAEWKEVYQS